MFKKTLKYKKIFNNRFYSSFLLTKDTIKKLPKADLHYHLDGSIRNSSIIELAKEDSIKLPTYDEKELRNLVVVPDNCQSLIQFLSAFDITLSVLQTRKGLERAMLEIAEDSVNDGVRYIEVRFSPVLHLKNGLSVDEVLEIVCGTIPKIESKFPLTIRLIVCGMRQMDPKISKELAQAALKFKNKGVVAFDLAGPENDFPSLEHREAYDIALGGGLRSTCHAGESDGPSSIKDAIDNARVSRIGHGIALIRDKNLLEEVKKKEIVLEVCPTSNFKTKATQTFEEHPIDLLYSNGVKVTVNTDDKLMCDIDLSDEFYLLHTKKNFEIQDLLVLMDNSFKYSFLEDEKLKNKIRKDSFNKRFQILEQDGFSTKNILQLPLIKRLKEEIDSL